MGLRDQLRTLMWQHGVEQETLLDALDWKFKKIADERDSLRGQLVHFGELHGAEHRAITAERDRLREALGENLFDVLRERDRLREALTVALPHLEENARYLRDMQAHAGKVVDAFKAVDVVKAALAKEAGK